MRIWKMLGAAVGAVVFGVALAEPSAAQDAMRSARPRDEVSHVVVPQARAFALDRTASAIEITSVQVRARIIEQAASTTMQVSLRNPGATAAEATLLLPVPDGAVVSAFAFEGPSHEPTARVLEHEEARRTYDDIVRRVRDPALLEFAGWRLVRSSVFPVPAGGTQRVRLTYEHVLQADGPRVDYVLPRSEAEGTVAPWEVEVAIAARAGISTVYSPTHELGVERPAAWRARVTVSEKSAREPGPLQLSYIREGDGVSASLFAYPDPVAGGGWFLLVAGTPAKLPDETRRVPREVTLVLDRSGSMAGGKLDQVRAASLRAIEELADGEWFNVIDYGTTVESFAAAPVKKDATTLAQARRYLASLAPGGGTNLHDALIEALRPHPAPGTLPIVVFLTDGLPTVGVRGETAIRDAAAAANRHGRRIFTLGVGADVNAPLLDRIAETSRATSAYVLPGEDVAATIDRVARRARGPVLASPRLDALGADGQPSTRRVREAIPALIPDLFDGDQLVVLGQYVGEEPLTLRLHGDWLGTPRTFDFNFDLSHATTRNSFVPRLWASRRIAALVDEVRQAGADAAAVPRMKELTDEIVQLSTRFGILTEYTSFLALEGTNLSDWDRNGGLCADELTTKAIGTRSGLGGLNQAANLNGQKGQHVLNHANYYLDANLNRVEIAQVRQVCDRAFFKRGATWVDSRLASKTASAAAAPRVVEFGSDEHLVLLRRLTAEGRQAVLALRGDVLLDLGHENVLVRNGGTE